MKGELAKLQKHPNFTERISQVNYRNASFSN